MLPFIEVGAGQWRVEAGDDQWEAGGGWGGVRDDTVGRTDRVSYCPPVISLPAVLPAARLSLQGTTLVSMSISMAGKKNNNHKK